MSWDGEPELCGRAGGFGVHFSLGQDRSHRAVLVVIGLVWLLLPNEGVGVGCAGPSEPVCPALACLPSSPVDGTAVGSDSAPYSLHPAGHSLGVCSLNVSLSSF